MTLYSFSRKKNRNKPKNKQKQNKKQNKQTENKKQNKKPFQVHFRFNEGPLKIPLQTVLTSGHSLINHLHSAILAFADNILSTTTV